MKMENFFEKIVSIFLLFLARINFQESYLKIDPQFIDSYPRKQKSFKIGLEITFFLKIPPFLKNYQIDFLHSLSSLDLGVVQLKCRRDKRLKLS